VHDYGSDFVNFYAYFRILKSLTAYFGRNSHGNRVRAAPHDHLPNLLND